MLSSSYSLILVQLFSTICTNKYKLTSLRSEHSSTSDSESARLPPAVANRLSGDLVENGGGGEKPPARGEVRLATQGQPMSR